ncbi:MAG: GAF sensor-containing diguanylate [Geobacteraceae bacterium]|nr:MAG: GAF sensor-containing diguanylate [Geobacteraceae bacterium]
MDTKMTQSELLTQIQRRNEELSIMMEIGTALTSSLDLQEVLTMIMGKVSTLLKPKFWSLLLVDRETEELYFEIAVSPVAAKLKKVRLKIGEGIAGWVAANGQPLLIADARQDERFVRYGDLKVSFTTRSVICVPLKVKDRVLGVIELINSFEDVRYGEADLMVLSAIADFAAIAIENARNYERVSELAITDDLTGLYNARHFNRIADREVAHAARYGHPLSLVFFDIDRFKRVNDAHGHLVGSRVLAETGGLIKRYTRSVDYAARFGGDEFMVLLPNTPKAGALVVVSHLRDILRAHRFRADNGKEIRITASFGIASYPDDAKSKTELLRLADEAMYAVKGTSRDGIQLSERRGKK